MDDEQSLLNEPKSQEESAAQAFARLDGRIAMMARAVEHLAAERASIDIPDYSATLGQMNTRIAAIAQGLASIAEKPAMQLTPEGLAARMDAAAERSRSTDRQTLTEAREGYREAVQSIRTVVGAARTKKEQHRHLLWTMGGGIAAGCLLWSILPGVVLRTLPIGWHMPESMAAHIMGEPNLWEAGGRMLRAGDPRAWEAILTADRVQRDNRDTIAGCERAASKAEKVVRCTIDIDGRQP